MLEIVHPPSREPERQYLYPLVFERWLGLPCRLSPSPDAREVVLKMAGESVTLPDTFFGANDWLEASSVPRALDDLLGGIFFMLTRYEEAIEGELDEHQRFPSSRSLVVQRGLDRRPVVDEMLASLRGIIEQRWPGSTRIDTTYTVALSHDVDWPLASTGTSLRQALRRSAGDAIARRDPELAARKLASWALDRAGAPVADPYDTFDLIMRESERIGVRSAFYFIADHTDDVLDGNYRLGDPWIRRLIGRIAERGHELGVHGSYRSHASADQLKKELTALQDIAPAQPEWGLRQHFLRWQCPSSWRAAAAAGFTYDTTLGFADRAGFRAGTARAFPVFDVRERRALPIEERPLIVMEAALLRAQKLDSRAFMDRLRALKHQVKQVGGTLSLLWHNNLLASRKQKTLYREALEELVA